VIGGIATAAAYIAWLLLSHRLAGAWGGLVSALLCGLVWLAAEIWITRGMHWDGVADLCDAMGSTRFWEVLKDSRMGTFGALGLMLVLAGQWVAVTGHVLTGNLAMPVIAAAWGRSGVPWLGALAKARTPDSLGGMVVEGMGPRTTLGYRIAGPACAAALWITGLPLIQAVALLAGQWILTRTLARIAHDKGGLSGDFFGAAIEGGQLWFLLVTL
jgi:adenosylcobinamide-GDP ribazoletransferase